MYDYRCYNNKVRVSVDEVVYTYHFVELFPPHPQAIAVMQVEHTHLNTSRPIPACGARVTAAQGKAISTLLRKNI